MASREKKGRKKRRPSVLEKRKALTNPIEFSDDLSPSKLADWLNQELKKKGLSLDQSHKKTLIRKKINGVAFLGLSERNLVKMEFAQGDVTNILKIISENSKASVFSTTQSRRIVTCSMDISPKTSKDEHKPIPDGSAGACSPIGTALWWKEKLIVQISDQDKTLFPDDMDLKKFFKCANRWSEGMIGKETNHIPKFERGDDNPDIIVSLNDVNYNFSTVGCAKPGTVNIDLTKKNNLNYREHIIVHEFGHVLGLGHEHQRSDFWDNMKCFINESEVTADEDVAGRSDSYFAKQNQIGGGATEYDPNSVMHYWFKTRWLKEDYFNKDKMCSAEKDYPKNATDMLKKFLKRFTFVNGVYYWYLKTAPSEEDLKFLSNKYNIARQHRDNGACEVGSASPVPQYKTLGKPGRLFDWSSLVNKWFLVALVGIFVAIGIGSFFLKGTTCHIKMVEDNIPELAETIEKYGKANDWCKYLHLTTCDHSGKNQMLANFDVSTAYLRTRNPCWEDIVRVLCKNLEAEGPAKDLAKKHNVDFDSMC